MGLTLREAVTCFPELNLKPQPNKGRIEYKGTCPFCGGKDRFYLYENSQGKVQWWCRRNCTNKSRPDFFYADALLDMLGKRTSDFRPDPNFKPSPLVQTKPSPPQYTDLIDHPVDMSMDQVLEYHKVKSPTAEYFGLYGITETTLNQFNLGYATRLSRCSLPAGFVIPNISLGPGGQRLLRSVQIRRDEAVCRAILASRSEAWIKTEKDKLVDIWLGEIDRGERPMDALHWPTDLDLVDYLFNKYTSVTGSQQGIFGDSLVTLPNKERIGPRLPYIFVTEDAKSAMVLYQHGYPAVAYKMRNDWNAYLDVVFHQCANVYIVADRDEKPNNTGVGLVLAHKIAESINKGQQSVTRIILPPEKINDVADLVRYSGQYALQAWVKSKMPGLKPIKGLLDGYAT